MHVFEQLRRQTNHAVPHSDCLQARRGLSRAVRLAAYAVLLTSGSAMADDAADVARSVVDALRPTQLSELIRSATAGAQPQNIEVIERLQKVLRVNPSVVMVLLRIVGELEVTPEQQLDYLAESIVTYHAVRKDLTGLTLDNPDEQRSEDLARAAVASGDFEEAVAQLHNIEQRELAKATAAKTGTAEEKAHRIAAVRARMLLGKMALMSLQYSDAAKYFNAAGLMMAQAPAPEGGLAKSDPGGRIGRADPADNAGPSVPEPNLSSSVAAPTMIEQFPTQIDTKVARGTTDPTIQPRPLHDSLKLSQPKADVASNVATPSARLGHDMVEFLLRRGEAMLQIGDVSSARLLYERAAASGDPRGATGVGMTYDPKVLAQLRVRGLAADPEAAAEWYRRARELADAGPTATAHPEPAVGR